RAATDETRAGRGDDLGRPRPVLMTLTRGQVGSPIPRGFVCAGEIPSQHRYRTGSQITHLRTGRTVQLCGFASPPALDIPPAGFEAACKSRLLCAPGPHRDRTAVHGSRVLRIRLERPPTTT